MLPLFQHNKLSASVHGAVVQSTSPKIDKPKSKKDKFIVKTTIRDLDFHKVEDPNEFSKDLISAEDFIKTALVKQPIVVEATPDCIAPIVEIISDELAVVRTENVDGGATVTGIVIQPPEIQTFNEDGSLAGVKMVPRSKEETVAARDRAIEDAIAASKVPAKGSSALAAAFVRSNEKRATQPQHANASANAKVTKRKSQ